MGVAQGGMMKDAGQEEAWRRIPLATGRATWVESGVAGETMAETDAESVRTESQGGEEPLLNELSAEQLLELGRNLSDALSTLRAETEMFEKFYKRLDPKDLAPAPVPEVASSSVDFNQMRLRRRSKSRSTISERLYSLSVEQKSELVQRELEDSKEEAQRDAESTERTLQGYKATMEEAEIRSAEIKKAVYEFERDIVKPALGSKKGAGLSPEKVLRYLEEKTRARDSLVDKLRLKNAALKIQKKKLQMQLKQKEEMGEVLNEVDFQQLKIENAQFLERIDERNQDLLQLKLTTGETLQVLNSYKKKLQNTMAEALHLTKEISTRNEMLQKIEQETELVEQERAKAESLNKKLRKQLSDYRVPEVLQYVQEKMEQEELEKSIRAWERKVEIAELSLKTQRRSWEQLKTSSVM
ncbi:cilia- and flagella-associated protein 263 isoform X1 [Hyperolius riggenbachi]|uniref:cilia- and flagella-associated protein 263 isoform X1 n=1 Tax=Hyperolius riggenbachi TaxID=752182 RepID=UPI0035A2D9B3